jgi:hypothetical protein
MYGMVVQVPLLAHSASTTIVRHTSALHARLDTTTPPLATQALRRVLRAQLVQVKLASQVRLCGMPVCLLMQCLLS